MTTEHENNDYKSKSGSISRTSSNNSLLRRRSLNILNFILPLDDDDIESNSVSEAGDIGDRVLSSRRHSGTSSSSLVPEDALSRSLNNLNFVLPLDDDDIESESVSEAGDIGDRVLSKRLSGISSSALVPEDALSHEEEEAMPWLLEYISCLLHLAVFGILGVLTRYLLQKLFGPGVVGATSDHSYMYLDLPSNMLGSFLMGWLGVVFKGDVSKFSDHLAIGLSTGYLGSLTTFSGWNQKMLDLSVQGEWAFTILGFVTSLFLSGFAIIVGIDTAQFFKLFLKAPNELPQSGTPNSKKINKLSTYKSKCVIMLVQLLMLVLLWTVSGIYEKREFNNGGIAAELWLGCLVGPFGVWIRWFLARLNGQGVGKSGSFKWIPFGTLLANVSAACVMAALATLKKAVNTKNCDTVASGIQFGLLGCLSTVSTFMAEFNAMRVSHHAWRAYIYALITIIASFIMGTLIYSVPVWVLGYD